MGSQLSATRAEVTVVVALKPDDPIERLRALRVADQEVANWLSDAVGQARQAGRSWAEIGDALGVFAKPPGSCTTAGFAPPSLRLGLRLVCSEEEAQAVADEELRAVRSRRRR